MKFEFSAGGVVYKKEENTLFILLAQHGGYTQHWGFPKGHIGDKIKGEKKEDAALREVKEETGITGEIIQELKPIQYWYEWEGEKRNKTVYFFLMKYVSGDFSSKDHEMQEVVWIPINKAGSKITFEGEKKVLEEAKTLLARIKDL